MAATTCPAHVALPKDSTLRRLISDDEDLRKLNFRYPRDSTRWHKGYVVTIDPGDAKANRPKDRKTKRFLESIRTTGAGTHQNPAVFWTWNWKFDEIRNQNGRWVNDANVHLFDEMLRAEAIRLGFKSITVTCGPHNCAQEYEPGTNVPVKKTVATVTAAKASKPPPPPPKYNNSGRASRGYNSNARSVMRPKDQKAAASKQKTTYETVTSTKEAPWHINVILGDSFTEGRNHGHIFVDRVVDSGGIEQQPPGGDAAEAGVKYSQALQYPFMKQRIRPIPHKYPAYITPDDNNPVWNDRKEGSEFWMYPNVWIVEDRRVTPPAYHIETPV